MKALAALACAALLGPLQPAAAADEAMHVRIVPPPERGTLRAGSHASIAVEVELAEDTGAGSARQSPSADRPVVLTPSVEGAAVEVVRGRLLRADAKTLDARHLRFDVPVVARGEGTAIFRVELASYVCSPRCRYTVTSASLPLRVHAR